MGNQLAQASSAYLRSAASQPIDWHEFGEAAFELARELDRPVLLDIGAVWCHWCHVIDRESYENEEIAELINAHYVAIKVDRDQRPDVDARYQQVVQSMSGQGGWPLTAFLTHDGRLIYGGTYFPPAAMKSLLEQIHRLYHERKQEIFAPDATPDAAEIERMEATIFESETPETVSPSGLKTLCAEFSGFVLQSAQKAYDPKSGGFGVQPKFPHFSTLEWMIRRIGRNADPDGALQKMLIHTLTRMGEGGIYDQIAGGFHRYSVDDHWHVPHFEKMSYDNAEALTIYSQAHRLTGIPFFRDVAEGIVGWVDEMLRDPINGGFYASQDADIDLHDDGDHFTWSPGELAEILTPEELRAIRLYYDVDEVGDMHHAKGRNVLHVHETPDGVARRLSGETGGAVSVEAVETLLESAKRKMREQRQQRPVPFVDASLYVNWNGMMIAGYFEAADHLNLPDARATAQQALERMLREFRREDGTVLHAAGVDGFLEDYTWLAWAALKGYQSIGASVYLDAARDIARIMLERFEDTSSGGFYDRPSFGETTSFGLLRFKRKPAEDNPSSSANAMALRVLQALQLLSGEDIYRESLEKGLSAMLHLNGHLGLYVSAFAVVADAYLHPPLKLEVAGPESPDQSPTLREAARDLFFPGKLVAYHPEEPVSEIRLCLGERCLPPVHSAERLADDVRALAALLKSPA